MARPGRGRTNKSLLLRAGRGVSASLFAAALTGAATMTADLTTQTPLAATISSVTATVTAGLLTDTVTLIPSANIPGTEASPQVTTAVMVPPAGKTTAQFRTGYILDDTRLTPSINPAQDEYTEFEWSVTTTSLAQVGDVIEFKVVQWPDDTEVITALTLPAWTLSATDTTLAASLTGTATFASDLTAPLVRPPRGVMAPTLAHVIARAERARVAKPNALQILFGSSEDILGLQLYADLPVSATVTAPLTTAISLNATLPALGQINAALTTSVLMAATIPATGAVTADLKLGSEIAASLTGTATIAPALTTAITMASSDLTGTATLTAAIDDSISILRAELTGTATMAAPLTTALNMGVSWLASGTFTSDLFTSGTAFESFLSASGFFTADLTHENAVPRNDVTVIGAARSLVTWRDNVGTGWLGIGTTEKLYVYATGVLTDVTPAGLVPGQPGSTLENGAYGQGAYGVGPYGTGDPSLVTLTESTVWSLDTFGQYMVGVLPTDGRVVVWEGSVAAPAQPLNTAPFPGTADASVPLTAYAAFVTPERFLVALGVNGNPRRVQWADQESLTVWAPTALNSAGDFDLSTSGSIRAGRKTRSESLIWTDVDLWGMEYIGTTLVYQFKQLGANCGAIANNSMTIVDGEAYWMSDAGFYAYNGYVQPIPCDVSDFVFSDFNRTQAAKVNCFSISQFNEIWWLYPSSASTENDRYVSYNRREGTWAIGALDRICGVDRGVLPYPIMVSSDGTVYEHEKGYDHDGQTPYAQSGFMEIMDGDYLAFITRLIPDERNAGDVEASFEVRDYPNSTPTVIGPYSLTSPTDLRVTGREVAVRVTEAEAGDWRVGRFRLKVQPRGTR